MRVKEVHDRSDDGLVSLAPGDRLQRDLPAFEELNQPNALDVFGRKLLVVLGTYEGERSQPAQPVDRLPGGGAELFGRQHPSSVVFHGPSKSRKAIISRGARAVKPQPRVVGARGSRGPCRAARLPRRLRLQPGPAGTGAWPARGTEVPD